MKSGWWKIGFDVTIDGIGVDIGELSEKSRQRILKLVSQGCVAGAIEEEMPGEGEGGDGE